MTQHGTHTARRGLPKWAAFLIIALVLALVCWICAPLATGGSSVFDLAQGSASATVGLTDAPTSLDVRTIDNPQAVRILDGNVYQGLTGRSNSNKVTPALAQSWDVTDGGKTYTFHLRSATFSNGDRLTASDVVWSLQQMMTKKYPGFDTLTNLSAVSAPNDSTVVMRLSQPNPQLLWQLSTRAGFVYCQAAASAADSAESSPTSTALPVGTGPYTVATWSPKASVTFNRNTRYWGAKTHFKILTLDYFPDSAALTTALKDGKIQGAVDISAADANALKNDSKYAVKIGETTTVATLAFNGSSNSLFSDKRMRQVLRMGIDRNAIVQAAGGLGTPLGGPITSLDPGYENLTAAYPNNLSEALKQRAYFLVYHNFTMAVGPDVPQSVVDAVVAQAKATECGITVTRLNQQQWAEQVTGGMKYDLALYMNHGSHNVGQWFTGTGWWIQDSPEADAEYNKAITTSSEKTFTADLKKAVRTLVDLQPADWLYQAKVASAWDSSLSGMPTNMTDDYLPLGDLK